MFISFVGPITMYCIFLASVTLETPIHFLTSSKKFLSQIPWDEVSKLLFCWLTPQTDSSF